MRIVLLCLSLLAALAGASATASHADDGGWTRIYSRPAPQIYDLEMANEDVGLALTAAGILRTDDGGRSWTEPYPIAGFTYGDAAFADARRAWAVAGSGAIRRTEDGGLTWRLQPSGTQVHLQHVAVVSAQEAWASGQGAGFSDTPEPVAPPSVLLHTTDGGARWQAERIAGYGQFTNVAFVGRTGWLVASRCDPGEAFTACDVNHRVLLRTEDGGRTWQLLSESPGVIPERMQWLDTRLGFATSFILTEPESGSGILALYRTQDGGRHWTRIESTPSENTGEIHFQSERDGWITANFCANAFVCQGAVWHTTDGGRTWTPSPDSFGGGEFFAVTGDAVLLGVQGFDPPAPGIARLDLRTGQWSAADTAMRQPLRAIDFVDRNRGYALARSRLLVTDDGGATWSPRDAAPSFDSIYALGGGVVWGATICCSDAGAVFRSIDGAATWQERPVPFGQPLALQAFDAERAIVSSSHEGLWRTDDGGATWRQIDTIAYGYGPLTFTDAQHGWTIACAIYTCRDSFRITSDGGATWETRALPPGAVASSFLTPDVGWATRVDCPGTAIECTTVIFATRDGGRNWDEAGRAPATLYNVTFVSPTRAWAAAFDSTGTAIRIVTTGDGGRTWETETAADGTFPTGFANTADRIWLLTAVGIQGGSDRTTIYRRDFAPEPAPPPLPRLHPPDTGTGPGGGRPWAAVAALLAAMGSAALAAAALTYRRTA